MKEDIGILLIHGIGDIRRRSILDAATRAVRRAYGREVTIGNSVALGERMFCLADADGVSLEWKDRRIALVEFNWVELAGKIRLRKPVAAVRQCLGLMLELPAAVAASNFRVGKIVAAVAGRLSQVILSAALIFAVGALGESVAWGPEWHKPFLPNVIVVGTMNLTFAIFVLCLLSSFFALWRRTRPLWFALTFVFYATTLAVLLLSLTIQIPLVIAEFVASPGAMIRKFGFDEPDLEEFLASVPFALILGCASVGICAITALALRATLVQIQLLRDVIHYLAPDNAGRPRSHQLAIRERLAAQLEQLNNAGYSRVVLVAHSLGSVILVDFLRGCRPLKLNGSAFTLDVVTAGSPMRRFIGRFFPEHAVAFRGSCHPFALPSPLLLDRWFNVYRLFDYVGQGLTMSALPHDLLLPRRASPTAWIDEHLLTPRFRWPFGHGNYWEDSRFVRVMAEQVLGPLVGGSTRRE